VTEQSYEAWDGKKYDWPPPSGWYLARDKKWWPEGYGPKSDSGTSDTATRTPLPEAPTVAVKENVSDYVAPANMDSAVNNNDSNNPAGFSSDNSVSGSYAADNKTLDNKFPADRGISRTVDTSSGGSGLVKFLLAGVVLLSLVVGYLLISQFLNKPAGSFASPHGLQPIEIQSPDSSEKDWVVSVTGASRVITDDQLGGLVADSGKKFVKADVSVENSQDAASFGNLTFSAATGESTLIATDDACMAQPGSLSLAPAGSTVAGFLCWQVPEADVSEFVLAVSAKDVSGNVFMSLSE